MTINKWTKFVHGCITWKEVVEKAITFKQWICSAWSRRRRRRRDGPRASSLKKALHCKIFMVSYLQFVERKHLHTGAFSTGCGASNVARKLSRQLSISDIVTILKNGSVKPSWSSQW
jgi:hypothetical protein